MARKKGKILKNILIFGTLGIIGYFFRDKITDFYEEKIKPLFVKETPKIETDLEPKPDTTSTPSIV